MQTELIQKLKDRIKTLEHDIPELEIIVQKNRGKYFKKCPPEEVIEEYHKLSSMKKELTTKSKGLEKIDEMEKSGKIRKLFDVCVTCELEKSIDKNQVCKKCMKDMYDDIIEIVYINRFDLNNPNKVITKLFKKNDEIKLSEFIKKIEFRNKLTGYIVFDMHNVLDTLPDDEKLFDNDYSEKRVCCSFVGAASYGLRQRTVKDIGNRILSGQVHWGALVFKRDRDNCEFHKVGSKAWFCNEINANYFVDDGFDHIESVKSINPAIGCLLIKKPYGDNFDKALDKLEGILKQCKAHMYQNSSGLMQLVMYGNPGLMPPFTWDANLISSNNKIRNVLND